MYIPSDDIIFRKSFLDKMSFVRELANDVCVDCMEHAGYKAKIMAAPKLKDDGTIHTLPSGIAIPAIPIYCLPGCPENWVRESGSYVIGVSKDFGLWFDWRDNDQYSTAIVPSVKGMNPITGQKMEGCQLEQYRDRCPIHDVPFAHGNYCEKCDYKWPFQGYVSANNQLWWDGFAQPDGTVRQFFYTEDDAKDIASLVIGKENTMPAFGFAFFKYKHDKPVTQPIYRGFSHQTYGCNTNQICCNNTNNTLYKSKCSSYTGTTLSECSDNVPVNYSCGNIKVMSEEEGRALRPGLYSPVVAPSAASASCESFAETEVKEVSIGAGAAIVQSLLVDKRPLSDYHEKPMALMRTYFVFENQLREIIAKGGIKKIEGEKAGFLKGLPVGG